ncbi:hypothetical protein OAG76_04115, partial [Rubripirellula sp.]
IRTSTHDTSETQERGIIGITLKRADCDEGDAARNEPQDSPRSSLRALAETRLAATQRSGCEIWERGREKTPDR